MDCLSLLNKLSSVTYADIYVLKRMFKITYPIVERTQNYRYNQRFT